ncbi:glycosyltransferase family 2 protein [Anaerolineales bacterium HSG25]|nr:glycosyltransferase family 2 protein [Anaerolineales bacterium HSG25]
MLTMPQATIVQNSTQPQVNQKILNGVGLPLSKTVVLIPAYNEAKHIADVVEQALPYADRVIVIDDGSTDRTAPIAELAGAVVVQHKHNQGKGAALSTGFKLAQEMKAEVVVTIDGDGQHDPREIPQVIEPIVNQQADLVIGSRYLVSTSIVPQHRVWGHRAFNLLVNLTSGIIVTDSQSGFRAFSPQAMRVITFRSKGFSVESEMQYISNYHRLQVTEQPITIRYDDPPKRNVWWHGLQVLIGILFMMRIYRPFVGLGLTGLLLKLSSILAMGVFLGSKLMFLTTVMFAIGLWAFVGGTLAYLVRRYQFSLSGLTTTMGKF